MNDLMLDFPKAKVLNAERVRFEIAGGNYRLVVAVKFSAKIGFIKFIGTHAACDRIDALTVARQLGDQMDLRPLRNDQEHTEALAEIERLWNAEPGTPEHDRLEVLALLVNAYEDRRWPIEPGDPVAAIKFQMEQAGHTQADLAKLLGSRSRASEILNRRRPLTIEMAARLHRAWRIPAECLILERRVGSAAPALPQARTESGARKRHARQATGRKVKT
jgi:HTH-type transcriptional regulator / antitoxin HigA